MVSWELHRKIGEKICGYSNKYIDYLVDNEKQHDTSRYDPTVLDDFIIKIKEKYGDDGLCYFVLHHYLDRLSDILIKSIIEILELTYYDSINNEEEFYDLFINNIIRLLKNDPKNILSLLVSDYNEIKHTLYIEYSGKNKRKQRKIHLENLEKTYNYIINNENFKYLRSHVIYVLEGIINNINCILKDILTDKNYIDKILNRIYISNINKFFRYNIKYYQDPKYIENLLNFINEKLLILVIKLEEKCNYEIKFFNQYK